MSDTPPYRYPIYTSPSQNKAIIRISKKPCALYDYMIMGEMDDMIMADNDGKSNGDLIDKLSYYREAYKDTKNGVNIDEIITPSMLRDYGDTLIMDEDRSLKLSKIVFQKHSLLILPIFFDETIKTFEDFSTRKEMQSVFKGFDGNKDHSFSDVYRYIDNPEQSIQLEPMNPINKTPRNKTPSIDLKHYLITTKTTRTQSGINLFPGSNPFIYYLPCLFRQRDKNKKTEKEYTELLKKSIAALKNFIERRMANRTSRDDRIDNILCFFDLNGKLSLDFYKSDTLHAVSKPSIEHVNKYLIDFLTDLSSQSNYNHKIILDEGIQNTDRLYAMSGRQRTYHKINDIKRADKIQSFLYFLTREISAQLFGNENKPNYSFFIHTERLYIYINDSKQPNKFEFKIKMKQFYDFHYGNSDEMFTFKIDDEARRHIPYDSGTQKKKRNNVLPNSNAFLKIIDRQNVSVGYIKVQLDNATGLIKAYWHKTKKDKTPIVGVLKKNSRVGPKYKEFEDSYIRRDIQTPISTFHYLSDFLITEENLQYYLQQQQKPYNKEMLASELLKIIISKENLTDYHETCFGNPNVRSKMSPTTPKQIVNNIKNILFPKDIPVFTKAQGNSQNNIYKVKRSTIKTIIFDSNDTYMEQIKQMKPLVQKSNNKSSYTNKVSNGTVMFVDLLLTDDSGKTEPFSKMTCETRKNKILHTIKNRFSQSKKNISFRMRKFLIR